MDDAGLISALIARTSGGSAGLDMAAMLAASGELPTARLPVDEGELARVERRLGFSLPTLLRRVYLEVANGGFGPGYGVIGIAGGHACSLGTLEPSHERLFDDPRIAPPPPRDRLVVWEFGGGAFACVDASSPGAEVVWLDVEKGGPDVFRPSGRTLRSCLEAWLAGAELYGEFMSSFGYDAPL